jgi:hypothetical protein
MRIDDPEWGVFFPKMQKRASQHRVFQHVGEISGMKSVAIIQANSSAAAHRRHDYA